MGKLGPLHEATVKNFVDPTRILRLAREIHTVAAGQDGVVEPVAAG